MERPLFTMDLNGFLDGADPLRTGDLRTSPSPPANVVATAEIAGFLSEFERIAAQAGGIADAVEPPSLTAGSPLYRLSANADFEGADTSPLPIIDPTDALDSADILPRVETELASAIEEDRDTGDPVDETGALRSYLTIDELLGDQRSSPDPWFAGVIVSLWRLGETGALHVFAQKVLTTIYLEKGVPVFAEGGTRGTHLGRILVRSGKITEAQLDSAVAASMRDRVGHARLGGTLVQLGFLTAAELKEALHLQARERILQCFQYVEVLYAFTAGEEQLQDKPQFALSLPRLLFDGIRIHYDEPRIATTFENRDQRYPVILKDVDELAAQLGLTEKDRNVLRGLDANRLLAIAQSANPLDRAVAGQLLAALLLGGGLELRVLPSREITLRARTPMGTAIGRLRPIKEDSGERHVEPGGAVGPWQRLRAEALFQLGKREAVRTPGMALSKFERAVKLNGSISEYAFFLAHTQYRLAKDEATRKEALARTLELAEFTLLQDNSVVAAHLILGRTNMAAREFESAEKRFRAILTYEPRNREATVELRRLQRLRDPRADPDSRPAVRPAR